MSTLPTLDMVESALEKTGLGSFWLRVDFLLRAMLSEGAGDQVCGSGD